MWCVSLQNAKAALIAKAELNLLAKLVSGPKKEGKDQKESDHFKINLFPDTSLRFAISCIHRVTFEAICLTSLGLTLSHVLDSVMTRRRSRLHPMCL